MKIFDELKKLKKQDISAAELAVNIAAAAMLFSDKMFTCKWWDFLSATHLGARVTDTRGLSFFGVYLRRTDSGKYYSARGLS